MTSPPRLLHAARRMTDVALNDLRALAAVLPPSERVFAAEVADVVGALVAVANHGEQIYTAAQEGAQGVLDFLHGKAVDAAKEAGAEEPQRGFIPTTGVTTHAPASSNDAAVAALTNQVSQLTALVQALAERQGVTPADTPAPGTAEVTPSSPASEPASETDVASDTDATGSKSETDATSVTPPEDPTAGAGSGIL